MKIKSFLFLSLSALSVSCSDDDRARHTDVATSFAVPSMNLTQTATQVQVLFSAPAPESGTLTLTFDAEWAVPGTDFTTTPALEGRKLEVDFAQGATSVSFVFNKLTQQAGDRYVTFGIDDVSFGTLLGVNKTVRLNFNEAALLGGSATPQVGGPNQPNAVYFDLSSGTAVAVARTSWDLGFHAGDDFKVILNNTVKMSARALATTNIDEVQVPDESMLINQGSGNVEQIDDPSGSLVNPTDTAIRLVSANESESFVYLVNLGSNPLDVAPAIGSEGTASGSHRGWKKIRVMRSGNDYRLQYADLGATTHQEVTIVKQSAHNFTFFSLKDNKVVNVEPQRNQWDLCFTSFLNIVGGTVPYHYPDYVTTNVRGLAASYQVMNGEGVSYETFTKAQVNAGNFNADQRNIGSNWRATSAMGPDGIPVSQFVLRTDRFYVVKDAAGNVYKLRFTGGANTSGERGYPQFEYQLLP